MPYGRRAFLLQSAAGLTLAATTRVSAAPVSGTPLDAAGALSALTAGNARFVADKAICPPLTARRLELAEGQSPFAIIVSCSDSRVPVETVFDQIPGNIFGIRIAGNFMDRGGVGSIEYAIAVLKSPLILVLGHSECGAVKAALAYAKDSSAKQPGDIQYLVESIAPGIKNATSSLNAAIAANVRVEMHRIHAMSTIVSDAVTAGNVKIAGGVYDLHSGHVTLLS
ncbi:MAG TPA: carbonic anhydrase [Candidatus Acidoferrum sp.]|jgi:carbonic anhydrase|nr:carbonic anhydrase [Candidatus Acidoferrum sp.]